MSKQHDTNSSGPETVTVSSNEYLDLLRLKILEDMKAKIERWASRRIKMALILFFIFGLIGIQVIAYVIIDTTLGKNIDDAKIATALMKDSSDRIKLESAKAVREVEKQNEAISSALEKIRVEAGLLESQIETLNLRAKAETENVRSESELAIAGLQQQIQTLTAQLGRPDLLQTQKEVKDDQKKLQDQFRKYSQYEILLSTGDKSQPNIRSLVGLLRTKGFKVSSLSDGDFVTHMIEGISDAVIFYDPEDVSVAEDIKVLLEEKSPQRKFKLYGESLSKGYRSISKVPGEIYIAMLNK